jgi:ABC-type lipopolysaccharide export system ATPase subunit
MVSEVVIAEQRIREVLKIFDRVYVPRNGQVCFSGTVGELKGESKLREVYL